MIQSLINQIRSQQAGREWPLQCLWTGEPEGGPVDWSATIPAHRSEGLTGLPDELPFALAVDEYASQSGRGYVIRIRARVNGEVVEMTDQDGPLIWTQQSFRLEMRPKYFDDPVFPGHGWRAEVIGNEGPSMGVRSLQFFPNPDHTGVGYTIGGAFTQQPSEYHPGLTVWAAETPPGQLTAEREAIHWAALHASIQEVKGTIGLEDEISVGRYFIGLEGEQELPEPGGGVTEWAPGEQVWAANAPGHPTEPGTNTATVRSYQGTDYECRQSHVTQAGWEPPNVLALWLPL